MNKSRHINMKNKGKTCATLGCNNKASCKGLCKLCYNMSLKINKKRKTSDIEC